MRVQGDRGAEDGSYFVLPRHAPDGLFVPTVEAFDLDDAAEAALLPDLAATAPYPAWVREAPGRGRPDPDAPQQFKIALTPGGAWYLIGRATWPDDVEMTHAELWGTFGPDQRAEMERIALDMRRSLHR